MQSQNTYLVRTGSCISNVDFADALVGSLEPEEMIVGVLSDVNFAGGLVRLLEPELIVFGVHFCGAGLRSR